MMLNTYGPHFLGIDQYAAVNFADVTSSEIGAMDFSTRSDIGGNKYMATTDAVHCDPLMLLMPQPQGVKGGTASKTNYNPFGSDTDQPQYTPCGAHACTFIIVNFLDKPLVMTDWAATDHVEQTIVPDGFCKVGNKVATTVVPAAREAPPTGVHDVSPSGPVAGVGLFRYETNSDGQDGESPLPPCTASMIFNIAGAASPQRFGVGGHVERMPKVAIVKDGEMTGNVPVDFTHTARNSWLTVACDLKAKDTAKSFLSDVSAGKATTSPLGKDESQDSGGVIYQMSDPQVTTSTDGVVIETAKCPADYFFAENVPWNPTPGPTSGKPLDIAEWLVLQRTNGGKPLDTSLVWHVVCTVFVGGSGHWAVHPIP